MDRPPTQAPTTASDAVARAARPAGHALRELQARLAARLQQARTEEPGVAWLAVECGRHGLLFPLHMAGEIFPAGTVLPLPHAKDWFVGVANLRGAIHGVVDLAGFLGLQGRSGPSDGAMLVSLGTALGSPCALLVQRLAGLRHAAQMQREPEAHGSRPAFAGARWRDPEGRVWQEIDLASLARSEQFLDITR